MIMMVGKLVAVLFGFRHRKLTPCNHEAGNFSKRVLQVAKTVSPISPPAAAPPKRFQAGQIFLYVED